MEWIPTVLIAFKVLVLVIGMFFAIKWHYDKAKRKNGPDKQRAVWLASGQVVAIFVVSLLVLLLLTFGLGNMLGLDLRLP